MDSRRQAIIEVDVDQLAVELGLPPDVTAVDVICDRFTNTVKVLLEADWLDCVESGGSPCVQSRAGLWAQYGSAIHESPAIDTPVIHRACVKCTRVLTLAEFQVAGRLSLTDLCSVCRSVTVESHGTVSSS